MDTVHVLYLVLALTCVMASAFFSSSETAFISLQKIRVKHMESQGEEKASRIAKLLERPEKFITTVLLGNNFVNTAAAALGTAVVLSLWTGSEEVAVLLSTLIVTVVLLVVGEVMPKIAAAQHSERVALLFVTPVSFLSRVLAPATAVLGWIGTSFSKLIGGTPTRRTLVTEEEIRTMIIVGRDEGVVAEAEAKMLDKVFEFGDAPVREAMIPRPDVVWVEKGTALADFLTVYSDHPHTRFPVYEDSPDNAVGVLSIKDVLLAQTKGEADGNTPIDKLTRPIVFTPETKHIGSLFREMQAGGNQMAVVVDEYGGIAGIVTLRELLAQLVGRFGDEFARESQEFQAIDEHTYEIDGSMRVEEVNEEMGMNLPTGDYETIAGLVLNRLGHLPKEGEQFRYHDLKFTVKEMRNLRIEKLRITRER
ncbi:MAG: HlyC/CorC family transporter [Dehalococcoidia bacterium]|nr:HlyC/CorC family transporter [Dehalococcoidia bacterium]